MIARVKNRFKSRVLALESWFTRHFIVFAFILIVLLIGTFLALSHYKDTIVAPTAGIEVIKGSTEPAIVIADSRYKRFYLPWCFQVNKIPASSTIVFESAQMAVDQGFKKVKSCQVVIG